MPAVKICRPFSFFNREGKAIISVDGAEIEIYDRDVSRLFFILWQIMDETDRQIARDMLEPRSSDK